MLFVIINTYWLITGKILNKKQCIKNILKTGIINVINVIKRVVLKIEYLFCIWNY
jgi:hypothetical protein